MPEVISRHDQRLRALELLYQADLRARPIAAVMADQTELAAEEFTLALVNGVTEHRTALDALIAAYARDWTLERMPVVDRNILRVAIYELHHTDVPPAVAINEAVELAKDLSTDDSGRFINGILSRAVKRLEQERP